MALLPYMPTIAACKLKLSDLKGYYGSMTHAYVVFNNFGDEYINTQPLAYMRTSV